MIQKIKLTNFRKFKNLEIDITKPIVILHGDNAKGKSTILEAIYILSNGQSPWASTDEYINNKGKVTPTHSTKTRIRGYIKLTKQIQLPKNSSAKIQQQYLIQSKLKY
jgi:recombinational DNA repair ATPase RecF